MDAVRLQSPRRRTSGFPIPSIRGPTLRLAIAAVVHDPVVYEDRHWFAYAPHYPLMPANTTTDAAAFSNKVYDILIVGGGTAGLALAAR